MKDRIKWIDIAKGIGILLVIIGHCPRDIMRENSIFIDFIYNFIYTFHMPFFFFISGYMLKLKKENKEFIISKFKQLIIPWAIFSILIYIIMYVACLIPAINQILVNANQGIMSIPEYTTLTVMGNNPYSFHVWFIYALFIIEILVYIFYNIIKKSNKGNSKLVWSFLFFATVIMHIFINTKTMIIKLILANLPFYILGIILKDTKIIEEIKKKRVLLLGPIIIGIQELMVIFNVYSNNQTLFITNIFEYIVGVPLTILFIIYISKRIAEHNFLEYLGKNSFNIYLLHQPFFCGMLGLLLVKIFPNQVAFYWITMIICFIFSVFMPIVIVRVINKIKLGKIFKIVLNIKEVN